MPERRPRFRLVLFSLVVLLGTGACSGPTTLQSRSGPSAPAVDGALDEWGGSLTYVEGESVRMSAEPTDSLLYVAVSIQDRRLIQSIAKNGLIVWVDPTGKKQRTYGIQYPLGIQRQRAVQNAQRPSAGRQESSRPKRGIDQVSLTELEIIRHDSTRNRIPAQFSSGLRAKAVLSPGSLIYELAIPVSNAAPSDSETNQQHGLRASLGSPVGVGLEVRESDEETNLLAPDQSVPSVTGRSGQGRRRRGRRRQRRTRQQEAQRAELPTLNVWTRVVSSGTR